MYETFLRSKIQEQGEHISLCSSTYTVVNGYSDTLGDRQVSL